MTWASPEKYLVHTLSINKDLDHLLTVLQKEDRYKKDGVPEELINAWVNNEKKKFIDAIQNDLKANFIEYALFSSGHITEDIMRKSDQLLWRRRINKGKDKPCPIS